MRVLMATRPFYGHLHPMLPVAHALVARGHDVVVATHSSLAKAVEEAGLTRLEAGTDPRAPLPTADEDPTATRWSATAVEAKAIDLLDKLRGWRPDVVVREQTDFGALLYAEAVDVPVALLGPAMYIPPSSWIKLFGDRLDRVRTTLGLPADPAFERVNPWLYLDPAPIPYQIAEASRIAVRHETQPIPVDSAIAGPSWLTTLPSESTVYLTLGTVFNLRPEMLHTTILGLLKAGRTVVVTTGPGSDPATLELPDDPHVHAVDYLPQSMILPHCAAVVSHGGFGSVMGAIWQGLPQVVIPLGSDNPTHASRCTALGLGMRLNASDVTVDTVAGAIQRVTADSAMCAAATAMGTRVRAMAPPEEGAELLEILVDQNAPVRLVPRRDRRRPKTAVVVPVLGRVELTRALLDDVAREAWIDPVVVDNGGDHVPIHGERVLRPGRNLGWAGACNLALGVLADRGYDAIVLLNNDTRLSNGFFAGLWNEHHRSGAWLVGPVYDGTWPHQHGDHEGDPTDYPVRSRTRDVAFLDGTCLFIPRTTFDEVGLLDIDSFPAHGWGVDLDYALRVRAKGGRVAVTEESFLHHDGGGTASVHGDTWKLTAWQELVVGMRRKYGVAWPRLVRDRSADDRAQRCAPDPARHDGIVLCPPVVVVGPSGVARRAIYRALNVLGLPPAPAPDQARVDGIARDLGLDRTLPDNYLPGTPDEVLQAPTLMAALDEIRASVGGLPTERPTVWSDASGGALVPFWAAAYDVDPLVILAVRNPLDVAEEIRAESGCDRSTALAVWERRLRLGLRSVVGVPVLVTRLEDLLAAPEGWAKQASLFVTEHGVPLLGTANSIDVGGGLVGRSRQNHRDAAAHAMTPEQQDLYATVLALGGAHAVFPDVALPDESATTAPLLDEVVRATAQADRDGGEVALPPEWVEWIAANRRSGVADGELLSILVERGLPAHQGRRALALIASASTNGRSAGHVANGRVADLSGPTRKVGRRTRIDDRLGVREEIEGPTPLPWERIRRVLCLAGGGGRQSAMFASLGIDVLVVDASERRLELAREHARRLGVDLKTVCTDMADLAPLNGQKFDLVYQPVSMCYVPDPAVVHEQVAGRLDPGGLYWVEHRNPVQMQLERLGKTGPPYRIVRPQGADWPVLVGDGGDELDAAGSENVWHYIHPLSALLGSLCSAGFEIRDLQQRGTGDQLAAPGTEAHLDAHVPPFFSVLAERTGVHR